MDRMYFKAHKTSNVLNKITVIQRKPEPVAIQLNQPYRCLSHCPHTFNNANRALNEPRPVSNLKQVFIPSLCAI